MRLLSYFFTLFCLCIYPNLECVEQKIKREFLKDISSIEAIFHTKYAPAQWKEEYLDWKLAKSIKDAKKAIRTMNDPSIKDYQRVIRTFFLSPKDYHVRVSFYSTELSILPFRLKEADNRYFIEWIDKNYVKSMERSGQKMPYSVGDEILTYNGSPISDVMDDFLKLEVGDHITDTDRATCAANFTFRLGAQGFIADAEGQVNFTARQVSTNNVYTFTQEWFHLPEEITTPFPGSIRSIDGLDGPTHFDPSKQPLAEHPFFRKIALVPEYQQQETGRRILARRASEIIDNDAFDVEGYGVPIGKRDSFIPKLGTPIWENNEDSPFDAYIFQLNGKRVGFLRIPTYNVDADVPDKLLKLINIMEGYTDALVVDQTRNPGGLLFYMYATCRMFADKPLTPTKWHHALSQDDVMFALGNIKTLESVTSDEEAQKIIGAKSISGFPVDLKFVQGLVNYSKDIIEAWHAGDLYTEPLIFFGIDSLDPHPEGHYTKPVVMLIDELDFSCGDFLPAILQDNKRVTFVGNTTSGAGGSVVPHQFYNRFGIEKFFFTNTLGRRIDGNPIENLGVSPEIKYSITPNDIQHDYQDYKNKILKTLDSVM